MPYIYVRFVADIDIKILGPGMPFLDNDTCAERVGGLFISARVFFPVCCHPWMDDATDGWMGHMKKLHKKPPLHFLLYVILRILKQSCL
jgi:hypothetical protein